MNIWPFRKAQAEHRQEGFTDTYVSRLVAYATGELAEGLAAGIETAAGWWQRAFSSADIAPAGVIADVLTPHLGYIGRCLVKDGEAVFEIAIENERLILLPVNDYSIRGDPNPRSWTYELTLPGPAFTFTRNVPADRVLHLRYAVEPSSPWKGVSPIDASGTTRKLLTNLETRLSEEAGAAAGNVIPVPNVSASSQLQSDLRNLKGQVTLVESTSLAWGAGASSAPPTDFRPARLGANPPESLRNLRRDTEESILAACGVPASVLGHSDGSLARELYRQFIFGVIAPVSVDLARQIGQRFEIPVAFQFDRLQAADLQGRARAFQSMVNGGMEVGRAAALAGLMVNDDD